MTISQKTGILIFQGSFAENFGHFQSVSHSKIRKKFFAPLLFGHTPQAIQKNVLNEAATFPFEGGMKLRRAPPFHRSPRARQRRPGETAVLGGSAPQKIIDCRNGRIGDHACFDAFRHAVAPVPPAPPKVLISRRARQSRSGALEAPRLLPPSSRKTSDPRRKKTETVRTSPSFVLYGAAPSLPAIGKMPMMRAETCAKVSLHSKKWGRRAKRPSFIFCFPKDASPPAAKKMA